MFSCRQNLPLVAAKTSTSRLPAAKTTLFFGHLPPKPPYFSATCR